MNRLEYTNPTTGHSTPDRSPLEWSQDHPEPSSGPKDCVTEVPLHGGRTLLLISYDPEGQPGPTSCFPAGRVKESDVIYLLERCREIYRESNPRHLKAV